MSEHLNQINYLDPELLQKLGDLELVAREVVEGVAGRQSSQSVARIQYGIRSSSAVFAGDAIRDLDWRVYGRTDRYYTKLYEAETNFDCHILMDASASMSYGSGAVNKLEYAKFLAASLAYLVLKQRDSVGLSVFDSEVRIYMPPRSSQNVIVEIDRLLRDINPTPKTTIAKQLHDIALMIKRRSFVILISDLFADVDDIMAGLDHLRFDGHNVVVLQTMDPYELNFPFKGTWRFEGLEMEDPLTTQPERVRDDYMANLETYMTALRANCVGANIDFKSIDISRPVDGVLNEFFAERSATLDGER